MIVGSFVFLIFHCVLFQIIELVNDVGKEHSEVRAIHVECCRPKLTCKTHG